MTMKNIFAALNAMAVTISTAVPLYLIAANPNDSMIVYEAHFEQHLPILSGALNVSNSFVVMIWLIVVASQVWLTLRFRPRLWLSSVQVCLSFLVAAGICIWVLAATVLPMILLLNDFS